MEHIRKENEKRMKLIHVATAHPYTLTHGHGLIVSLSSHVLEAPRFALEKRKGRRAPDWLDRLLGRNLAREGGNGIAEAGLRMRPAAERPIIEYRGLDDFVELVRVSACASSLVCTCVRIKLCISLI